MQYDQLMQRLAREFDAPLDTGLPRRSFLKLGAVSGFALGVFPMAMSPAQAAEAPKATQQPSAFIRIDKDGIVTVRVNRLEFGQGVQTGLPMLVAEEMDADWSKVRSELAPAGEAYKDPNFGIQMTGGSNSMHNSYLQYRELGARARVMLVAAAAERFGVRPEACSVSAGVISAGSQHAGFGELAAQAMQQPVPGSVKLKHAKAFKIVGKPTGRLDAAAKSSGRQSYGIDAQAPGMKTVLIARPPVFGAKLASLDAAKAKVVKGVLGVFEVPLDRGASGVAIVAEGYWPAKMGRDALQLSWNTDSVEKVDSDRQLAAYRELATQPGLVAREGDTSKIAAAPKKVVAEYSFP